MRTNLENPFYFVKDNIIYNIQENNSGNDECGKHYKTFDTVSVELKKGSYYYDKNGTVKIAENDGDFEVSLNTTKKESTISANKSVFPHFDVTYQYVGNDKEESVTYWLDDLIADGDKMSGGKFVNKTVHSDNGEKEMTYVEYYKNKCLDSLANDVVNGLSISRLAKNYPFLMVNTKNNPLINADTEIKLNGQKVIVISSDISCSNEEIVEYLLNKIKEYGDEKVLNIFNKSCEVNLA